VYTLSPFGPDTLLPALAGKLRRDFLFDGYSNYPLPTLPSVLLYKWYPFDGMRSVK
jgi:hypothetical protein